MKIVQTFWSDFSINKQSSVLDQKCGWLSAEYHWMSWALSCLQLRKFYKEVELVTDNVGKEVLIDILQLPYTKVTTALEGRLSRYPKQLFSLAKIFTYQIQNKPFIHLDGDVFLYKSFNKEVLEADLVSQNLEADLFYYRETLEDVLPVFGYIPLVLQDIINHKKIYACNAGIFGGKNLPFIKAYAGEAFNFIDRNLDKLGKINVGPLNFLFEQCLFYYLAKENDISITYFMEEPVDHPLFKDYVLFSDLPDVRMIHTVGGFKRLPYICDHLSKRLRKDYPDYYYRIIQECRENNLPVRNKIYSTSPFIDKDFYPKGFNHLKNNVFLPGNEIIRQNIKDSPLSTSGFPRTKAALQYFNVNISRNDPTVMRELDYIKDLINEVTEMQGKEQLKELFELELEVDKLRSRLCSEKVYLPLYFKDVLQYETTEQFFQSIEESITRQEVVLDEETIYLELNWDWNFENKGDLNLILERNLNEEKSFYAVALTLNVSLKEVHEEYLDQLDMIIIELCKTSKKIGDIIEEIKKHFDPTQLEDAGQAYKKLILDSIKRLMYAGVLRKN